MKQNRNLDLTKGSPIKVILLFALPMLLGNVFQQLYTTIDSLFMGRFVSSEAMAAVGACSSMINFFQNITLGMATGLGIVISQYVGAHNDEAVHRTAVNAVLITLVTAIVMTGFALCLNRPLLRFLGTPDDVVSMADTYSTVILSGILCTLSYNMTASILRGMGNSRAPLYFLIFASVLHVILDFVLILGLGMGVAGVGFATIISQGVSAVTTLIYMYLKYPLLRFRLSEMKPDKEIIGRVCRLGIPMGLQSACFTIGMMVITKTINSFGTTVLAGYTAGVRVEELSWILFTTYCHAIATYAGQNAGAKDIRRLRSGIRTSGLVMLILTLSATALCWAVGRPIISLFTTDPDIQDVAYGFLKVNSAFYLPMGALMLYNFSLKGMGEIAVPMVSAFVELFCKIFFSLFLSAHFGFFGIWFAEPIGWVLALIPSALRYYFGNWEEKVMKLKT